VVLLVNQLACQVVEAVPYSSQQHGLSRPLRHHCTLSDAHVHHALHAVQNIKPLVRCGAQHCPQASREINYGLHRSQVATPSSTQTSPNGGRHIHGLHTSLLNSRRQAFANSCIANGGTTLFWPQNILWQLLLAGQDREQNQAASGAVTAAGSASKSAKWASWRSDSTAHDVILLHDVQQQNTTEECLEDHAAAAGPFNGACPQAYADRVRGSVLAHVVFSSSQGVVYAQDACGLAQLHGGGATRLCLAVDTCSATDNQGVLAALLFGRVNSARVAVSEAAVESTASTCAKVRMLGCNTWAFIAGGDS